LGQLTAITLFMAIVVDFLLLPALLLALDGRRNRASDATTATQPKE
jgi:predicted RND superfamily exporter protein